MRTSNLLLFAGLSALIVTFAACGDDDEQPAPTTTSGTTSGTGGSGGDTTSTGGSGGSGGDTTSTGGTGGTGGGVGGSGGAGGGEQTIHGCTLATAEDLTGSATVTITGNGNAWEEPHNRCIVVNAGTTVTWQGVSNDHPLSGGEQPTPDASNPIESHVSGVVVFAAAGTFPYFCDNHPTTMNGVVYVE